MNHPGDLPSPYDVPPRDIIDVVEDFCAKSGFTQEVGTEFYLAFIALTDKEIAEMAVDLIRHQSEFLKAKPDPIDGAVKFVTNMLNLVATGTLGFDEYGRITFRKPIGRQPDSLEYEQIDGRIARATPIVEAVAHRVLGSPSSQIEK